MSVTYKKLWILLAERELKKTDLIELCGISPVTLTRLGKNEDVSMEVLQKICKTLECNIGDIVDYVADEQL